VVVRQGSDSGRSYSYRITNIRGIFRVTNGSRVLEVQHVVDRESLLTDQGYDYLQSYAGYRTTLSNGYSSELVIANHYSNYAYQVISTLPGQLTSLRPNTWTKLLTSEAVVLEEFQIVHLPKTLEQTNLPEELLPAITQLLKFAGLTEVDQKLISFKPISLTGNSPTIARFSGSYAGGYSFDGEISYQITQTNQSKHFTNGVLIDKELIDQTDRVYSEEQSRKR
jgi:hypothetical protein